MDNLTFSFVVQKNPEWTFLNEYDFDYTETLYLSNSYVKSQMLRNYFEPNHYYQNKGLMQYISFVDQDETENSST